MPMTEDMTVFFNASEHGTTVQLDGVQVTGILDRAYAEAFGMASVEPMFTLATADAPHVAQGSVLVAGVDVYRVRVPQADGTGVTVLLLEAQ